MSVEMAEAIQQLAQDRGISEEAVLRTIEDMLKAAYKRKFGTCDNAVVKISEDLSDVSVYSRKQIVDGWTMKSKDFNPVKHIDLEDALELSPECEVGNEIDILVDLKEFDYSAVQVSKQNSHQSLSDIQKDRLYAEYKDKIGEIIIGYYQRERNGNIYVDLGGKVEGILPAKFQSPRETYHKNDRIKALITDLKKTNSGLQLVLSRTDPEFVRKIIELEVPELYDKTIEIQKIVREAGYRTKIAVYSHRDDIDPVGSCVGPKGVRIQSVIRELEGEKIDVLKYEEDPSEFIKNALSPAEVSGVILLDEVKRQALAVVPDSQFSLAIGKQGLNVRLANRLVDWNIDVKTEEQYGEMDDLVVESRKAVEELFADDTQSITTISELPGVDEKFVKVLKENGIEDIEHFIRMVEDKTIFDIEGVSKEDIESVETLINDTVEFIEDSSDVEESEAIYEEEYVCPECGTKITIDMTVCPNPDCGIGLSFEEEDE
ncbi:MAG: transcription termination/antitermination protein NusA [Spirochaetaceae bacterium]|nr:transcription termination/antitermination protein NusA [Spirochaetaceae bacterium]